MEEYAAFVGCLEAGGSRCLAGAATGAATAISTEARVEGFFLAIPLWITDIGFAAAAAAKAAGADPQYTPLAQQLEQKKARILSRRGTKKPQKKSARNQSSGGRKQSTYAKRGGERA